MFYYVVYLRKHTEILTQCALVQGQQNAIVETVLNKRNVLRCAWIFVCYINIHIYANIY